MFYYPTFAYISIVRIGVWGIHQVSTNLFVIVMHELYNIDHEIMISIQIYNGIIVAPAAKA